MPAFDLKLLIDKGPENGTIVEVMGYIPHLE